MAMLVTSNKTTTTEHTSLARTDRDTTRLDKVLDPAEAIEVGTTTGKEAISINF